MKVSELKKILEKYDDNAEVAFWNIDGAIGGLREAGVFKIPKVKGNLLIFAHEPEYSDWEEVKAEVSE